MRAHLRTALTSIVVAVLALATVAVRFQPTSSSAALQTPTIPGMNVTLWAQGTSDYSNPDSIEYDPYLHWLYVGYQNVTAKDGTDGKSSTIVEYTLDGQVRATFSVPGHCDGLRVDPANHLLWATSNEDGNPRLAIINPVNGYMTDTALQPTPHGGGYDDLAFTNGKVFIAASNPNVDSNGNNVFPAVWQMSAIGFQARLVRPVLMGNDSALDTTTKQTVTLNEVDPDSMTVDPQGDLVLDNQAGSELVFLHNPGDPSQAVSRIPLGTQVDDFGWAPSANSRMLIVDGATNAIWQVTGTFTPGTVYAEAPNDSGVASFLGSVDLSTGTITPVGIGFVKPTGLAWLPPSS